MKSLTQIAQSLGCLVVLVTLTFAMPVFGAPDDQSVLADFQKHVKGLAIADARKAEAIKTIEELKSESAEDAITEGLMLLYPEYAKAVEASDNAETGSSIELLQKLANSEDHFLAADATFYLARTLMNEERFEQALPMLQAVKSDMDDFTIHGPSAQYFIGVAQAGMLDNKNAINSFMEFLEFNPMAAERLRVSAWRQIQQLQAIKEGQLRDVHQRMDFSRRRLQISDTGETTQEEQEKIVLMLNKLIKEQEKKECSSCNSNSSKKQQQKDQQQAQKKPKPKPSKSQKGGKSANANGKVVEKSYDDSPASPWSRLRDRSRDPANNAIKDKLPARYRDIVERYYEAANGTSKK